MILNNKGRHLKQYKYEMITAIIIILLAPVF